MMIDLYLRAGTEADLAQALPFLRSNLEYHEDGTYTETADTNWLTASHDHALDLIGPVCVTPGTYDPETMAEVTPPVIDARFHANLRCTQALADKVPAEVRITPTSPRRVWA